MSIVNLIQITKEYKLGEVRVSALQGVDLEIKEKEFVVVAGPSGSGKTTTLNIIGCIDKPSSGRVYLIDKDITEKSLSSLSNLRRDKIGFIFQTFNLIPVLNVFENVEYPLLLGRYSRGERKEMVDKVLQEVGLYDRRKHKPNELSGGERQRVAIARALVKRPALVLADEPTANLDSHTSVEIIDLMKKLNKEEKISFIFSSHDPLVIKEADRVINIRDGRIIDEEDPNSRER